MQIRTVMVKVTQSLEDGGQNIYTFTYPECDISFRVTQDSSDSPDNCYVKVLGVDRSTYGIFNQKKNKQYVGTQRVDVYYGYDDNMSLVFSGTIDRVMYGFDHGRQSLSIFITKNSRRFNHMIKSIAMTGSQSLDVAIRHICNVYGYNITFGDGNFEGISCGRVASTTTLEGALKAVLPRDYGFYVNENTVHVYQVGFNDTKRRLVLWSENGLLSYPTEDSNQTKTTFRSILIPGVESGMVIYIPIDDYWFSLTDTGKYRTFVVQSYVSTFENGLGTTEFECEGGINL